MGLDAGFGRVLREAGLADLPISWGEDGTLTFGEAISPAVQDRVRELAQAYVPQPPPDPTRFLGTLKAAFPFAARVALSQQYPWFLEAVRAQAWDDVTAYCRDAVAKGRLTADQIAAIRQAAQAAAIPLDSSALEIP